MLTLSSSSCSLFNNKNRIISIKTHNSLHQSRVTSQPLILREHHKLGSLSYNPLRMMVLNKRGNGFGAVCYSSPLTPANLHWISTVSTAVLMQAKGTTIHKSFLVPLFALYAPASIVAWMKGEYGIWTALLVLLVRLFFFIPGELELPFITFLLVIVSPNQITRLRGTKEGIILSLVISAYLAYEHFKRAGNLGKPFDQGSIIATIAIICIVAVPCLLLI